MKEADVIVAALVQSDGAEKRRPAIILREMPPYGDFLVCGVSTQLHQRVDGFDDLILSTDADFGRSGLLSSSLIRLGFLAVLPRNRIVGTIGSLSPDRHARLLRRLSAHLTSAL